MDIELTERNWRIAAKIVLHALREKQAEVIRRIELNEITSHDYDNSEFKVVDDFELEMIDRGITALSDILL